LQDQAPIRARHALDGGSRQSSGSPVELSLSLRVDSDGFNFLKTYLSDDAGDWAPTVNADPILM
jgi:hypothetical protein